MKVSNLLKSAALGLFIGLAGSCSNEEFQNGLPDQTVNLKDGETLVKMKIAGIGGTVKTRANENITLPGEVQIGKLDLYCFVNLTAANGSEVIAGTDEGSIDTYTLERVYKYKAQGSDNDLALTPVGDGYQASFGIIKDTYKRVFVLIANDIESRTGITAVTLATATVSGDRSSATALSALKEVKILESALTNTNIPTPLPMTGTAGRNEYTPAGVLEFNTIYTKEDIENGTAVSAELKRQVARIDIKNPVAANFTVTSVQLKGAENSLLFTKADNSDVPDATTGGDYDIVTLDAKVINVSSEMLPAALYAYPVKKSANGTPSVVIKGKMGGSGEISVEAKFDESSMPSPAIAGMMPNTRYIVNLHNSEGNITADITIADWIPGETVDTEDVMGKLNATAKLAAAATYGSLDGKVLSTVYAQAQADDDLEASGWLDASAIATIEGKSDGGADANPIGIILSDDCDWLAVEDNGETGTNSTRKYTLRLIKKNITNRPWSTTLSLVTYNATAKKQVIDEYTVFQDHTDMTQITGEFPTASETWADCFSFSPISADENNAKLEYVNTYKFSPFGLHTFMAYQSNGFKWDLVIPENCSWLSLTGMEDGVSYMSIDDNIGKEERRATIEVRRYQGGAVQTKKLTIIQSGTVDKTTLTDAVEILLNPAAVSANLLRMDGNTILLAGCRALRNGTIGDYFITVKGKGDAGVLKPVLVTFEETDTPWIVTGGFMDFADGSYLTKFSYLENQKNARETHFTVTTYANGAPVAQTYRLIQKADDGNDLDGNSTAP